MAKKSKRKQRRKAKVAATVTPATTKHDEPLDLKMHRLQLGLGVGVGEDADGDELLEEAIKLAVAERKKMAQAVEAQEMCTHGLASDERIKSFCLELLVAMNEEGVKGACSILAAFEEAVISTSMKFDDVYSDATKMDAVIGSYIGNATATYLAGEKDEARRLAVLVSFLENSTIGMLLGKRTTDLSKEGGYDCFELYYGNDRTLVSFLKKRLPCSCLDEVYKEVKSMKKMGFCWNKNCKHHFFSLRRGVTKSDWELDRSSLMACSRCRHVTYCSVECQKADWRDHQSMCNEVVEGNSYIDETFGQQL